MCWFPIVNGENSNGFRSWKFWIGTLNWILPKFGRSVAYDYDWKREVNYTKPEHLYIPYNSVSSENYHFEPPGFKPPLQKLVR
jgi:hypothetical protein